MTMDEQNYTHDMAVKENKSLYGWRARIGLILPSGNVCAEPEFNSIAPEGVTIHSSRILLKEASTQDIMALFDGAKAAAGQLATAHVDTIGFVCTAGSFLHGVEGEKRLMETIREESGVPSVTTSLAVVNALKKLNITNVAIATPYVEDINRQETMFFESLGFNVTNIKGLGFIEMEEFINCPEDRVYRLAGEVDSAEADGVFISCTGWKGMSVAERLESDLKKPVVTSNQATFHALLSLLGINEKIAGFGRLLDS